jgi:ABC-2 type transport system ATP-binding protein
MGTEMGNGSVIRAEGLTRFYGRHRGIVDLDLDVARGEVFGFLGPNGAGKTTTIRLLLDFIRPTRGRIQVLGLDTRRNSVEIRRRVGYLPGELRLYDSLSGTELLAFFGHLRGGVDWTWVRELAERFECDIGREVRELSHGNRQKLGLIQAFMNRPDLLILDEPTTGLDPLVQQSFFRLMAEQRASGTTVFISSHVLPEVERLCDRVAMIAEGQLLTTERVDDLKRHALRSLELTFAGPVPAAAFEGIAGVQEVSVEDARLRCRVIGSVDHLLKAASRFEVLNVASQEPTLEEIFVALYARAREETEAARAA